MDYDYYSDIFKVLADKNRIKILNLISSENSCACQLLDNFDIKQPTFTHHIKVLKECGLINSKKEGTKISNTVNIGKLNEIKDFIDELLVSKECKCLDDCKCRKGG